MKIRKKKVHIVVLVLLLALLFSIQLNAQKKSVACVGNSITAGYGLSNPSKDSYPSQLFDSLRSDKWIVGNYGASGRTMLKGGGYSYWDDIQYNNALNSSPDFVVIGLGTNDSKDWLWNWLGASDFKKDYKSMVQSFQELTTKPHIYLFLLVPGEKADWGIYNSYIDKVNIKIKEVALEMGLNLIDLHSAFDGHFPGWFQADSVHPTVEGATEIALKVREILLMSKLEISFAHDSVTAPDGFDYQWYIDGAPVTSANGGKQKVMAATKSGLYKVSIKLSASNDTRVVSNEFQVTPTGSSEIILENSDIEVYPNPSTDNINIKWNNFKEKISYTICNFSGNVILSGQLSDGRMKIDISSLYSGAYLLCIDGRIIKIIKV